MREDFEKKKRFWTIHLQIKGYEWDGCVTTYPTLSKHKYASILRKYNAQ